MKWIKRLLISLVFLCVILLALLVALPWLIDPNDLKPQLQQLAAERGYGLQLQGPIEWQFYPALGLSLSDVSVQTAAADTTFTSPTLLQIHEAQVAVALRPLLSRRVQVNTVSVDGAEVQVEVSPEGKLNWDVGGATTTVSTAVSATPDAATNTPTPGQESANLEATEVTSSADTQNLVIAVDEVLLNNVRLHILDRQNQQETTIDQLSLAMENIALGAQSFPLTLALQLQHSGLPVPLQLALKGKMQLSDPRTGPLSFAFSDGQLTTAFGLDQQSPSVSTTFTLSGETADDDAATVTANGQLALQPFNAAKLLSALAQPVPTFANPKALQALDLSTQFTLTSDNQSLRANLNELLLHLDQSTMKAQLSLIAPKSDDGSAALPQLNLQAHVDRINVDHYLSPTGLSPTDLPTTDLPKTSPPKSDPSNPDATASTTPSASASTNTPLPLEALRAVNAELEISVDEAVIQQAQLTQTAVTLNGKNGVWNLANLSTQAYAGKLQAKGQADARGDSLKANINAQLHGIDVHKVLSQQAQFEDLSGNLNGDLSASLTAATVEQILAGTDANLRFSSDSLTLQGFNAEQSYCEVVAQVQQTAPEQVSWPTTTTVTDVSGQARLRNQRAELQNLQATMGAIALRATGDFDLQSQRFSVRLPTKLETVAASQADDGTDAVLTSAHRSSSNGCTIKSKFLINRELDILHCKGTLDSIEFGKKCGIDQAALRGLLKEALRYNAKKQLEKSGANQKVEKKKQEVRDKFKDKLQDVLGGDSSQNNSADDDNQDKTDSDSTRDLLKNIFNRD